MCHSLKLIFSSACYPDAGDESLPVLPRGLLFSHCTWKFTTEIMWCHLITKYEWTLSHWEHLLLAQTWGKGAHTYCYYTLHIENVNWYIYIHLNRNMRLTDVIDKIIVQQIFIAPSPPTFIGGMCFMITLILGWPMTCYTQLKVSKCDMIRDFKSARPWVVFTFTIRRTDLK